MTHYTLNIYGGTVQLSPNASTAIQYVFGESGPGPEPLALYIEDGDTRRNYLVRITQCPDVVTLCKTVLTDLFNEVLADYEEPAKLIKSKEFIQALIPLLPFESGKTERNIRHAIRKYVLGEG